MYAKNNFFTSMAGAGEGNSKCAGKFISIIFWKDVKGSDSLHPPPPPPPPPSPSPINYTPQKISDS